MRTSDSVWSGRLPSTSEVAPAGRQPGAQGLAPEEGAAAQLPAQASDFDYDSLYD